MFRKIATVSAWFLITPIALILLLIFFKQKNTISDLSKVGPPSIVTNNSVANNQVDSHVLGVQVVDNRPFLVAKFLNQTALAPYSDYLVQTADKYGLDYRLIPAIAMKESGGGNAGKVGSYNAWGFDNGRTNFTSWEQAIDSVGKTLKEKYVDKGLITPEEIMPIYAPPQLLTGGKWAKDINYFFSKMKSL